MYPKFSDLIQDIFGVEIAMPFSSFGVMLAFAFIIGCYFFALELWRKEESGLIKPITKVKKSTPPHVDFSLKTVVGFIIGYKLIFVIANYADFVSDDLSLIFSFRGNWWGGIIGLVIGILVFLQKRFQYKNKSEPHRVVTIHQYQLIGKMALMDTIFCFIGARLFYYIEDLEKLMYDPINSITRGGLNIYGGLIFGAGYIIYFIKKEGLDALHFGDASAPALMLAYGVARLGCHLSGDGDWGVPNDLPKPGWLSFLPDWMWAYDYHNNVLGVDLKTYFVEIGYASITGKAWPTPIYEFLMCLIFFLLLWIARKKIKIPGLLFSIYLMLNGIERFFIEIIRTNPVYSIFGFEATMAQVIAIILFGIGSFGIWYFAFRISK